MRVVPPQPSAGFAAVLLAGLAACSPSRTGPADPAPGGAGVTYGTIVGARAVTARGVPPGAGPAPGDVAGTVGGRD